jgi:hypothetical protein
MGSMGSDTDRADGSDGGGSHTTPPMSEVLEFHMASLEDFQDLLASLRWGASLPLSHDQQAVLRDLCCKIGGIPPGGVPRSRLKETADRARKAEQRVEELETALRSSRNEWQFRRGKRA